MRKISEKNFGRADLKVGQYIRAGAFALGQCCFVAGEFGRQRKPPQEGSGQGDAADSSAVYGYSKIGGDHISAGFHGERKKNIIWRRWEPEWRGLIMTRMD